MYFSLVSVEVFFVLGAYVLALRNGTFEWPRVRFDMGSKKNCSSLITATYRTLEWHLILWQTHVCSPRLLKALLQYWQVIVADEPWAEVKDACSNSAVDGELIEEA